MKKMLFPLLFALSSSLLNAQTPPDALLGGKWWTGPKQEAQIAFFRNPNDSTFCGKLIWMKYPDGSNGVPVLDTKNPDRTLRNRPLLGITLIDTLIYRENGLWTTRRMYVPGNGVYVRSSFTLEANGNLSLRVTKLGIVVRRTFVRVPSGWKP